VPCGPRHWRSLEFLLAGVLGFIPGITTGYDSMAFAGHHSDAHLLGVFQVSVLHNLLHLLFGLAGLTMARTTPWARLYLPGAGPCIWSSGCTASSSDRAAAPISFRSTAPTTGCT
jgi:hypothetical protein